MRPLGMSSGQIGYVITQKSDSLRAVRSTPLRPAFSAAFAGLGELVSWLWNPEGNDLELWNDQGNSLLYIASYYGTAWIVAEMLKGGCGIQEALYPASEAGKASTINLLLDLGADVNLTGGLHGTALAAVTYGGNLAIVTLLLDRGAGVNLTGGVHHTALAIATLHNSLACHASPGSRCPCQSHWWSFWYCTRRGCIWRQPGNCETSPRSRREYQCHR